MKLLRPLLGIFVAFSLFSLGTSEPSQADTSTIPLLRANIVVDSELVLLGDIFANAGSASEVAVFRAPTPGSSGVVGAERLVRVARQHGLEWDNPESLHRVSITRSGIEITVEEIAASIEDAIASQLQQANPEAIVTLEMGSGEAIFVAVDAEPSFEISRLRFSRNSGRFSATVTAPAGSPAAKQYTFTGRASEVRMMAVLLNSIARGEVIGEDDVDIRPVPVNLVPSDAVLEASALVGKAARRHLQPERPVRVRDLEEPRIVQRNDIVTVRYEVPGLTVTVRARALDAGALGATVRILNLQSNRIIEGTVVGVNAIKVTGVNSHVVASAD